MSRTDEHREATYGKLQRTLMDARSREVVFVSHCLLNQNTRYLGGAVCPGVVCAAVMPYVEDGVGIVQMPCPEQRVWGGVLKRRLLWLLVHPRLAARSQRLMPVVERCLRWRYRPLARRSAREVADYTSSGFHVRGVVGIAGSPSCGVQTRADLQLAAAALAHRPTGPVTAAWLNRNVIEPATCPGAGLFMSCLADELTRRGQRVPLLEVHLSSR